MVDDRQTFEYRGRKFHYFDHPYNATITNERAVEIPIALDFIERHAMRGAFPMGDGLEVGNVLSHYTPRPFWTIVDLGEKGVDVLNVDMMTIEDTYDWVVSLSTVEHVQHPHNLWASSAAILYLRGVVKPYGPLLVTCPMGWNGILDEFLLGGGAGIPGTIFDREDVGEPWVEVGPLPGFAPRPYGPTHGARTIWIGEWGK